MRKVSNSSPATTTATLKRPKRKKTKVAKPSAPKVKTAFTNGKADNFRFKDKGLQTQLNELQGDAVTMQTRVGMQDDKAVITGTARSKDVPGGNGYADYLWNEQLGADLYDQGMSLGSGAGGGAMESPMRGASRRDGELDMKAGRPVGWQSGEPTFQGANIIIQHEQGANPFIPKDRVATFERFLFRMEALFRKTNSFIATPGGFGTVAEVFTYRALKTNHNVSAPIAFGSYDDFYGKFTKAFAPLMLESERGDLKNVFTDTKKLAKFVKTNQTHRPGEEVYKLTARMRDDIEHGLSTLDGKPPAIAFFGGSGPRTQASAGAMGTIAEAMAKAGNTLRVGGSSVLDPVVLKAAQKANPKAELEAFALNDAKVSSQKGMEYTHVKDLLVLRELMDSNLKGIVVSPEGAMQIGQLFAALCDMQTKEIPKVPVVVLDPDGKFAEMKKMLAETMISQGRQYIDPADLDLFKVTNDPQEAIRILNTPIPADAPAPAPAASAPAAAVAPATQKA